ARFFGLTSRDHRRFIVFDMRTDADTNLYLVERGKKGTPALLTPHTGEVLFNPAALSKDGKTLYYLSDEGRELAGLFAMNLATRASEPVAQPEWDVTDAGFSHTFRYFYVTTNVDGQPRLEIRDTQTQTAVSLPQPPPGGAWVPISSLAAPIGPVWIPIASSRSDRYLGVWLQSDVAPAAPYVLDLANGDIRQVIEPLPESL